MDNSRLSPIHPGEILLDEFLKPFGISQYRLANETMQATAGGVLFGVANPADGK